MASFHRLAPDRIELAANWSFQMTELDDKTGYLRGTRHALILIGLVPLALFTLPAYWALWGTLAAIGHTVLWVLLTAKTCRLSSRRPPEWSVRRAVRDRAAVRATVGRESICRDRLGA